MLALSDGKQVLVPLSVQTRLKGLIRSYISSPAGTFGGWISGDELQIDHATALFQHLNGMGNLTWRVNPYDHLTVSAIAGAGQDDETQVLDLAIGFDQIYRNWTKGHKAAARQAKKEGVKVRLAADQQDWHAYYEVYEDSLRRWGENATSRYKWPLFEQLARRNSPHIQLWLAEYQGRIIAGALAVSSKDQINYWHGATLEEYFNVRPVHLLMYVTIEYACAQGYRWFDFNPSGGHAGVKSFKKSFGTMALSSPVIHLQTPARTALLKIAHLSSRLRH